MYTLTRIPVIVTFDVVQNPLMENIAGQTCYFSRCGYRLQGQIIKKAFSTTYIYSVLLCCRHLLYLHTHLCWAPLLSKQVWGFNPKPCFPYLLEAISGIYFPRNVFPPQQNVTFLLEQVLKTNSVVWTANHSISRQRFVLVFCHSFSLCITCF